MQLTDKMRKAAMKAKTVEELIEMAKESGLSVSEEQAKEYFEEINKEGELSDDELENVAGGDGCDSGSQEKELYTFMRCSFYENNRKCYREQWQKGDWMNREPKQCPDCGNLTLKGAYTSWL